jgi:hypothetical protein
MHINIEAGDTLIIDEPGTTYDSHLWIVISDPTQSHFVLLVNLTSFRDDKDTACVLGKSDHRFIKHKSCVNYASAKWLPTSDLLTILSMPQVSRHDRLADDVLKRIRESAINSRMDMGHFQILLDQGLVSE